MLVAVCLFVLCFLLGSIPWGLVISKLFYHTDIRKHGSGNIGTTNAMRTMGKRAGAAVFVLDFSKGLLAGFCPLLACWFFVPGGGLTDSSDLSLASYQGLAFLACVWGHIFSPWLNFKGGKGIAVAVGSLFFTFGPLGALIELAIFIIVVVLTRYVSAGSLAAAVVCPFLSLYLFFGEWLAWICCVLAALTVIWAHRANIQRLRQGTESRIGSKGSQAEGEDE